MHRSLLRASALRGTILHVALVDGYAPRWLRVRLLPVGPRGLEPLTQSNQEDRDPNGGKSRNFVRAPARAALLHKVSRNVRLLQVSPTFYLQISDFLSGRCWVRTSDLCRVKASPPVRQGSPQSTNPQEHGLPVLGVPERTAPYPLALVYNWCTSPCLEQARRRRVLGNRGATLCPAFLADLPSPK